MARQYTLPQVIVQQDFALIPAAATQELLPVIVGPQKKIISLDDPDDANYVTYGAYDYEASDSFDLKGLASTDVVYADSVKVTLKDVKAKYATLTGATGVTMFSDDAGATVQRNKIQIGSGISGGFATYGEFPRASVFSNRDVAVGDKVSITPAGGSVLNTRVLEVINEVVPASAGSFSTDVGNSGAVLTPAIVSTTDAHFLGSSDTTYEVRVVKAGNWTDGPQVIVLTNNGIDSYGTQTITSASAQFNLGSLGVKANFGGSGTGLTLGNKYYVTVTAAAKGEANVLRLSDSLPSSVLYATALSVDFFLNKASVEVPATGYPMFGSNAWTLSSDNTSVTLNSAIQVLDSTWVDDAGDQVALDVVAANIFIEYKALVRGLSNQLTTFTDPSSVNAKLGQVVPDNTLAYGVYKALLNSGGHTVYAVALESDDLEGYIQALEATEGEVKGYYMVPLTNDEQVIQLFKGHVLALSDPSQAMERVAIVNEAFSSTVSLYDKKPETDEAWSGYVSLGSSSGIYNLVTIPGATLLGDGVRVGDLCRSNFALDASGNTTYDSYQVNNVIDEENLEVVAPGFDTAIGNSTHLKTVQVVRNLSKDEQAAAIAANSAELGNRRVVNIWPDYAMDGSTRVAGYFVAAAVAGLKSSVAPHQPLTNVTLDGFTDITRAAGFFTPTQLNAIANGGTWIVTKVPVGATDTTSSASVGSIVTRHQLTTDYTDDNMAEVSVTTNLDSISKWLRDDLKVIIGQYNNHPYMIQLIRTRLEYRLTYLQGHARTLKAGPQLISYKINSVAVDELIRTKVNADVDLVLPYPINNINLKLTVV